MKDYKPKINILGIFFVNIQEYILNKVICSKHLLLELESKCDIIDISQILPIITPNPSY